MPYLTILSMLALAMTGSVALAQPQRAPSGADGSYNCDDFDTQVQAQNYYDGQGGFSSGDPDGLDADSDGEACEDSLPAGDDAPVAPTNDDDSVAPADDDDAIAAPAEDDDAAGDQYADDDDVAALPDTGGPALLPLAGLLALMGAGSFVIARVRR